MFQKLFNKYLDKKALGVILGLILSGYTFFWMRIDKLNDELLAKEVEYSTFQKNRYLALKTETFIIINSHSVLESSDSSFKKITDTYLNMVKLKKQMPTKFYDSIYLLINIASSDLNKKIGQLKKYDGNTSKKIYQDIITTDLAHYDCLYKFSDKIHNLTFYREQNKKNKADSIISSLSNDLEFLQRSMAEIIYKAHAMKEMNEIQMEVDEGKTVNYKYQTNLLRAKISISETYETIMFTLFVIVVATILMYGLPNSD